MIGGILLMSGAISRLITLATDSFIFVLCGSVIGALGQAFL
jgi:hypothetical protein